MEEQNIPVEKTENVTNAPTQNEVESSRPIEAVYDVPVVVSAVLGSAKMLVSDLLKLTRGSIVELERRIGDPLDIYVNNRLIAKGEVVSVDDKLAITMTEVIKILK
ncbi:MAG: flagellar motor switch protein FliN [Alphaproteobacteria bacterium]|nr:flagellar motor switch protein FliN [Alphaproteobacteria bacterium]